MNGDSVISHWSGPVYAYDPYGNTTSATARNGATSTVAYDDRYRTFPIKETSPSLTSNWSTNSGTVYSLDTYSQYDPRFGVTIATIDENGIFAKQDIDGFGRSVATY